MHLGVGGDKLCRRERVHVHRVDSDEGTQSLGPRDGRLGGQPWADVGVIPFKQQHAGATVSLAPVHDVENVAPVFVPIRRAVAEDEGPDGSVGSRDFHL